MTSLSDQIVAVLGEHHYWNVDMGRCQCGFALSTEYQGAFVPHEYAKVMYRHLTIEEHAAHLAAQLLPLVVAAQAEALREMAAIQERDVADCPYDDCGRCSWRGAMATMLRARADEYAAATEQEGNRDD